MLLFFYLWFLWDNRLREYCITTNKIKKAAWKGRPPQRASLGTNGLKRKSRQLPTFPGRPQYHRRKRAWLPCSEWERVLPLHHGHRHLMPKLTRLAPQGLSSGLRSPGKHNFEAWPALTGRPRQPRRADASAQMETIIWSSLTTY